MTFNVIASRVYGCFPDYSFWWFRRYFNRCRFCLLYHCFYAFPAFHRCFSFCGRRCWHHWAFALSQLIPFGMARRCFSSPGHSSFLFGWLLWIFLLILFLFGCLGFLIFGIFLYFNLFGIFSFLFLSGLLLLV